MIDPLQLIIRRIHDIQHKEINIVEERSFQTANIEFYETQIHKIVPYLEYDKLIWFYRSKQYC